MFIELTSKVSKEKYMMNIRHIVAMVPTSDKQGTIISHTNDGTDVVDESYEQVKELIRQASERGY